MICKCGEEFTTPWCPQCGEPCSQDVVLLIAHLKRLVKSSKKEVSRGPCFPGASTERAEGRLTTRKQWLEFVLRHSHCEKPTD